MKYIKHNKLTFGRKPEDIENNLEYLIHYIYNSFPLNHDEMISLYDDIDVPIKYDDNEKYDGNYNYRYKLRFCNFCDEDDEYYYDFDNSDYASEEYDNSPFIEQINEYLSYNSPENLKILDVSKLDVCNGTGRYKDVRGCRYLDWRLHFWECFYVSNPSGINLHDLIIAVFKIKCHKFENEYESFAYISNFQIDDDSITICLEYDHVPR